MRALTLVSCHKCGDVICHDADQRCIVEAAVGDPAGKLAVPDKSVAAELLLVLGGILGYLVRTTERELASIWLRSIPFHGVLGSD